MFLWKINKKLIPKLSLLSLPIMSAEVHYLKSLSYLNRKTAEQNKEQNVILINEEYKMNNSGYSDLK